MFLQARVKVWKPYTRGTLPSSGAYYLLEFPARVFLQSESGKSNFFGDPVFGFGPISLLLDNPLVFLIAAAALLFGLVLHNVVQARLADRLGDSSARLAGFASTEPQRHFEPLNLIFFLLLGLCVPRAIPLYGSRLRGRGAAEARVWLSGPLTLIIWAFILLLVDTLLVQFVPRVDVLVNITQGLAVGASFAIIHAVVFMVPLPDFDAGHALYANGSASTRQTLDRIAAAGPLVTFIFFLVLSFSGVLGRIVGAVTQIITLPLQIF